MTMKIKKIIHLRDTLRYIATARQLKNVIKIFYEAEYLKREKILFEISFSCEVSKVIIKTCFNFLKSNSSVLEQQEKSQNVIFINRYSSTLLFCLLLWIFTFSIKKKNSPIFVLKTPRVCIIWCRKKSQLQLLLQQSQHSSHYSSREWKIKIKKIPQIHSFVSFA
jgi:hypothetical protein